MAVDITSVNRRRNNVLSASILGRQIDVEITPYSVLQYFTVSSCYRDKIYLWFMVDSVRDFAIRDTFK